MLKHVHYASFYMPMCQLGANNFPQDYDPYHRTESKRPQEKPHVYIGDPCMVNPN